ncbi:uncharacterized protein LOC107627119 [Arachis ipaensis]|uniref:uncharacterized protein LOC107627119 n=1 Tax=Arachis ipaensis TaxID=130454 RepID=UPI0007AF61B5|nr:uncharacterized protein LOC107627119 [Arachis ipaensis]XP_025635321.1 uncharacterized protein LOC112729222 [Arachis hypogaea]
MMHITPDQYGKKVGSDRNSNKNRRHDKDSETNVQALLHRRSLSDDEKKLNVSKVVTSNETKREVDRVFTFDEVFEGQCYHRPPLLNGTNYLYWKNRMAIWIKSQDLRIWDVIENGNHVPMKTTSKEVGEVETSTEELKPKSEWTDDDYKKVSFNFKAINYLHCAITQNDYMMICTCETAKEIWDKLSITHEGIGHVKQSKISHLVHEYELFRMKEDEKIEDMFGRFSNIIASLNLLGRKIPEREVVRKI